MKSDSEPFSNNQQPSGKSGKSWRAQGDTKDTILIIPNLINIKFARYLQTNIGKLSNYHSLLKKN